MGSYPEPYFVNAHFVFSMMAWHLLENMGDFQGWNDIIETKSAFGGGRNHALNCFNLHGLQISTRELFRKIQNIENIHHERHAFVHIDHSSSLKSTIVYNMLKVKSSEYKLQKPESARPANSVVPLVLSSCSIYPYMLGRACQILLGSPKPMLIPRLTSSFFGRKIAKKATLIQISYGKPFFFKTRSPNLALLKLFLGRLSPQPCL
jgi:hypothetical protein